jgi:hypothetical protein
MDWSFEKLNAIQFNNSDIITYHNYDETPQHRRVIELLKASGRPLICTEYMARTRNSRFSTILPLLKEKNVGAINWGFVEGKTNTITHGIRLCLPVGNLLNGFMIFLNGWNSIPRRRSEPY